MAVTRHDVGLTDAYWSFGNQYHLTIIHVGFRATFCGVAPRSRQAPRCRFSLRLHQELYPYSVRVVDSQKDAQCCSWNSVLARTQRHHSHRRRAIYTTTITTQNGRDGAQVNTACARLTGELLASLLETRHVVSMATTLIMIQVLALA